MIDRQPDFKQYSVRDNEHICSIRLASTQLYLGQNVDIHFDFSTGLQSCQAIRASIILYEKRIDNTNVQVSITLFSLIRTNIKFIFYIKERVVISIMKSSESAKLLNIYLQIPAQGCCSFFSPLIKVRVCFCFLFCGTVKLMSISFSIKLEYRLLFEFFTLKSSNEVTDEPLSFSIPVDISYKYLHGDARAAKSKLSRNDFCLLSLESSLMRIPIVIDG
jgi:hypothetical protein